MSERGPDIVMGSYGQPQLYPDKCLDLTELANYLGDKYGGWYDAVKAYCMTDGRWIALGMGFPDQLRGLSREHGQGGRLQRDPARPGRLPEAVPCIESPWHATRLRARQCDRRRHDMVPLARLVAWREIGRREGSGRDQLQGDPGRARVCEGAVSDTSSPARCRGSTRATTRRFSRARSASPTTEFRSTTSRRRPPSRP